MCRTPKNPEHPDGCRCTACGWRAHREELVGLPNLGPNELAWLRRRRAVMDEEPQPPVDPMRTLESLTPGGSEYHNDHERCAAYVRDRRESQHKIILRLTQQRNTFREALQKAYTCRASMNSAVVSVIEEALWPGETKPHEIGEAHEH